MTLRLVCKIHNHFIRHLGLHHFFYKKSQEITEINTNSRQKSDEMYKFINLSNLMKEIRKTKIQNYFKTVWIFGQACMEFDRYHGNVHLILQSTFGASIKNCNIRKLRLRYATCVLLPSFSPQFTFYFLPSDTSEK